MKVAPESADPFDPLTQVRKGATELPGTPGGPDQLGSRAARGAAIMVAGQGVRIVIQVASVVVLARLLSPRDYGLMALALVMVGIGEIFRDFGLSTAAIQAPELSFRQRDGLFWLNTAIGAALALTALLAAPLFAALFSQPELTPMARAMAGTFLINGLASQYRANLNRSMRFAALVISDLSGGAIGLGVAVTAALLGAGRWALVAQQLTQVAVVLIILVMVSKWIPGLPKRGVDLKPFLRFGWHLMGTQLIGYLSNNLDSITIGYRFGTVSLGIYNRAFQLIMNPLNQLRTPTTTVALPVLSSLQHDLERSGGYIKRGQIALGYTIVAGLALAAGAARPMVEVFLGDKWIEVAPIFALLAVAGIAQTLSYVGYWVYLSRGLTKDLLRYTMVTFCLKAVCIGVGSIWGVVGVAAGYTLAPCLAWPLSLWWLSRRTVIPLRDLWLGALRILGVAAAAGLISLALVSALDSVPPIVVLVVAATAVIAVYAVLALLVSRIRADLEVVLDIVRKVTRRRSGAAPRRGRHHAR